jgi:hypothetical protein
LCSGLLSPVLRIGLLVLTCSVGAGCPLGAGKIDVLVEFRVGGREGMGFWEFRGGWYRNCYCLVRLCHFISRIANGGEVVTLWDFVLLLEQ